ncbi:MAG: CHASE2 domain-containing protein [Cyanobacteria bacterium J06621_11]
MRYQKIAVGKLLAFLRSGGAIRFATRELLIPGALMIGLVCLVRFSGLLQTQEWMLLDSFSRYCSEQEQLKRVTLVTVDEGDYQTTGFPISADVLAQALTNLQTYRPRVIGLDIFRDLPQEQGQDMLQKVLSAMPNVVVAEVALSDEPMMNVDAPAGVSPDRVGFADSVIDVDGKIRRIVLSTDVAGYNKESLALLLARAYLKLEDVEINAATLPKFYPDFGGYVRTDTAGNQMMLNFCMLQRPGETVSLKSVLQGRVDAEKIRDRIVLIGKASTSPKDSFITSAVSQTLYSKQVLGQIVERPHPTKIIYGVEIHSHAIEQIIDSAMGHRQALTSWPEVSEYVWIVVWGLLGMFTSVRLQSPWKSACVLIVATLVLSWVGYYLLAQSLWIPVVPAVLALWSAGLITAFFDRDIRFELVQRRATIERTYEAVHNGPLQRLADISRAIKSMPSITDEQLLIQLHQLNGDMRNIFERLRLDTFTRIDSLYLNDATFLNLQDPLSDLLYQVYEHTLSQPFLGFEKIQVFVTPIFEVLDNNHFGIEEKRGLCLFLQEALSNVGQHAIGATRLDVVCKADINDFRLQIIDNGAGLRSTMADRQGTRQSRAIAQQLNGHFYRVSRQPSGIFCELRWPK